VAAHPTFEDLTADDWEPSAATVKRITGGRWTTKETTMSEAQVNVVEACAMAAHEVNRVYCIFTGDRSQPRWEDAPDWQKESVRHGVEGALAGNTPEQSHEGWLKEKAAAGWKWGSAKDPAAKEHPCMLPYAELPAAQQQKDHLFIATVRAVAKSLGRE
jgi:hypothetical protein